MANIPVIARALQIIIADKGINKPTTARAKILTCIYHAIGEDRARQLVQDLRALNARETYRDIG